MQLEQGFKFFIAGEFDDALSHLKKERDSLNKSIKSFKGNEEELAKSKAQLKNIYKLIAEASLELGDLESSQRYFLKTELKAQAAFSALLRKNLKEAKKLYEESPESLSKNWGLFLCNVLNKSQEDITLPGFLCIRLFLESTIAYMLKHSCTDYLEILFDAASQIEDYFPEYRKYIGSAYLGLGQYEKSIEVLKTAEGRYPQDSEIYFKLAQDYMLLNDKQNAIKNFQKTLELLPGHIASTKYLETLTK